MKRIKKIRNIIFYDKTFSNIQQRIIDSMPSYCTRKIFLVIGTVPDFMSLLPTNFCGYIYSAY